MFPRRLFFIVLCTLAMSLGCASKRHAEKPAEAPEVAAEPVETVEAVEIEVAPFLRVAEERDARIALEVAVREFTHPGYLPTVALMGIAHVGDKSLYSDIQKLLEDYDIVLYEAVTPPGVGRPSGETAEERVQSTQDALRLIASIAEAHKADTGSYPKSVEELRDAAKNIDGLVTNWLTTAMIDAWGGNVTYEPLPDENGYRITSYGADNSPGGEGEDADLTIEHEDNVNPLSINRDNLQQQLATALKLSYQLTELSYDAPNWRSSDMDVKELNDAFRDRDLDFGFIDTIGGTTFPAQLARMLLGVIGALDQMMEGVISDIAKIMMIEMLGDEEIIKLSMGQMGPGFGEVLIDLRNQVVIDDLAEIARNEPEVQSVAILYGAAHMQDMADRLTNQLGYEPGNETWITAMSVDLTQSRLDPMQIRRMRMMMRRMLHQQMQQLRRMQGE